MGLARMIVYAMAALAAFVQLGVWGATKIRTGGALLESWQPYFGWVYGLAFGAALVGVCGWLGIDRGIVWLARTWTVGAVLLGAIWLLGGRWLQLESAVALVSGLGAYVLAAGLAEGRLAPDTARRDAAGHPTRRDRPRKR